MLYARVAIDRAALIYDKLYDYTVPSEMSQSVMPGVRVMVPFGRYNTSRQGMVFEVSDSPQDDSDYLKYKPIDSILDREPVLAEELLGLASYLSKTTFCSLFESVKAMLPPGAKYIPTYRYFIFADYAEDEEEAEVLNFLRKKKKGAELSDILKNANVDESVVYRMVASCILCKEEVAIRKVGDETVKMARLTPLADKFEKPSSKQAEVLEYLIDTQSASIKEIEYYTGVSRSTIDTLERKGIIEYFEEEAFRRPYKETVGREDIGKLELSDEQKKAYDGIAGLMDSGKYSVSLLFGVTGSGKTQVFLKLIEKALADGKSVILMVPEISLTPQMLGKFISYFGDEVAVVHSALSQGERLDEWKRIQKGDAHIVIGTRSAVFAPVKDPGLIIMDEEQETSYKSDRAPRFDARDAAAKRASDMGIPLLLASATPSIETFYRAKSGKINLFEMKERYGNADLPESHIIDMNEEIKSGNTGIFSEALAEEIQKNLENGEQTILLMNRRGYNTVLRCARCGAVMECPRCNIPLTYHKANGRAMCHYCGYSRLPEEVCETCGSKYVMYQGCGTQKVEDELHELFPEARILRMDLDTTMAKYSHDRAFSDFQNGKYDIMVGTQMVAKGLDFPNVTLVGVLAADMSLYSGDYRSYERTFSLLTQVIGRCGRASKKGRAYIQTHSPEHKVLNQSCSQDYGLFYSDEIINRKVMLYPPFCRMGSVMFSSEKSSDASKAAERFSRKLQEKVEGTGIPLRILGPTPSRVARIAGEYRWKLIIKYRPDRMFYDAMGCVLKEFTGMHPEYDSVRVTSDPYDIN